MTSIMLLNLKRANEQMEKLDLDSLIATTPANVTYFTGFPAYANYFPPPGGVAQETQIYSILPKHGKPVLVIPFTGFAAAKHAGVHENQIEIYGIFNPNGAPCKIDESKTTTTEEEILQTLLSAPVIQAKSALEAVVRVIKKLGLEEGCNGIESISPGLNQTFSEEFPKMSYGRAPEVIRFIKMVKTDEEVSRLRRAAEITEHSMNTLFDHMKPGVTGNNLYEIYKKEISQRGGYPPTRILCSPGSSGGSMPFLLSNYPIKQGDLVWVDCGCSFEAYRGDTGETAVISSPSKKQVDTYEASRLVVDTSEKTAAPGMKPSELLKTLVNIWEKKGVPKEGALGYGHGLGMEVDYPITQFLRGNEFGRGDKPYVDNPSAISDDYLKNSFDIPFEAGMVMAFEAPYAVWGWGGSQVEMTYLMTNSGCKPLIPYERYLRQL